MNFAAVIAAAGSGQRLKAGTPKGFVRVGGKPLFLWSVERFRCIEHCAFIVVVVPPGFEDRGAAFLTGPAEAVVEGGAEREESVRLALARIPPELSLVAVHDAARPATSLPDIRRTLKEAERCGAACLGRPVADALTSVRSGNITGTLEREGLWQAETPQVFHQGILREAFGKWKARSAPDEASVVTAAGFTVHMVRAESWNPKLTFPQDLAPIELLLSAAT